MTPSSAPDLRQAVAAIEAMVQKLRGRYTPGAPAEPVQTGWWVVLCGKALDPQDYAQRERVRRELADQARELGLVGSECVWIWDESETAQVVIHHAATHAVALAECERLRALGLRVRLIREFS